MSPAKNPRVYFALVLLLVSATVVLLREHRPSFLRPSLHMYAYVSTDDGSLTVLALSGLHVVAHIPVGTPISDLREHPSRDEIWGISSTAGYVWVLDAPSGQLTRIPVGPSPSPAIASTQPPPPTTSSLPLTPPPAPFSAAPEPVPSPSSLASLPTTKTPSSSI